MLAVLALLCTVGVLGGYGVGRAADAVRAVLPSSDPGLPADKAAPPEPIDLTGPATTCRADAVDLTLSAATPTAVVGDSLVFSVKVTNTGRVPCLVDGGSGSRTVTVRELPADASGTAGATGTAGTSSGSAKKTATEGAEEDAAAPGKRVWSSGDCTDGETMLLLGVDHVAEQDVRWRTERSTAKCADDLPALEPGTYQAYAELADVPGARSEPVTVTVTAPPEPSVAPSAEGSAEKGDGGRGAASGTGDDSAADDGATDDGSDDATADGSGTSPDGSTKDKDAKGDKGASGDRPTKGTETAEDAKGGGQKSGTDDA
ncbi:hypothetical protein [Isoptericola sp. BMS4]|uniref:hypothetical protein n=1 Tax=Isoptericola sp. BMS4 TaxID=2527875 RepID=UPI001423EEEE|nr:hypothetical protein [Isoptericola sp. BMS4]